MKVKAHVLLAVIALLTNPAIKVFCIHQSNV